MFAGYRWSHILSTVLPPSSLIITIFKFYYALNTIYTNDCGEREMPKENNTKSWKEKQSGGNLKQHRSQIPQSQRAQKIENRRRMQHNIKIIISTICLITLVLASYGIWQYYDGQKPPTIGGAAGASASSLSTASAPNFSLKDINGTQVSLSQFKGKVIGIHFMAVGCHGQINPINEYQLTQLNGACNNLCGKEDATFLTVAVATCESSDLGVLRSSYGVSWILGNDYADGTLEIVNSYVPFEIRDGTVVLIDKTFSIAEVYQGGVSANQLVSKISQLSGA